MKHACSLLVYVISVITPGRQRVLTAFRRYCLLKNKLRDRMIKQLLNSVIAKYRDLSVCRRSIICLSLRLRQIIDLLATDKSRYFAQPRPIIANYFVISKIQQLVVYYQGYNMLYPTSSEKRGLFGGKKGLKSSFN